MSYQFVKMHGLGNDFIIIDARASKIDLTPKTIQRLANRRLGIGCDQLIALENPKDKKAAVRMRIFNADGGEAEACGNAARCVAWLLKETENVKLPVIETIPGLLETKSIKDTLVQVDMGIAKFDWTEIPLSKPLDSSSLTVTFDMLCDPVVVNIGNPHIVFFVKSFQDVDLDRLGKSLSTHSLFPEGVNVEIVEIQDFSTIRVHVWERGVGPTPACGSGACASAVAACKRSLTGHNVIVHLEGGDLEIEYTPDGHVLMSGLVEKTYCGEVSTSILSQKP